MALQFSALPPERKQEMLRLLDRWYGAEGERRRKIHSEVLVDTLRILAIPGSRSEFLRRQSSLSPRENTMLSIAFIIGEGYQGKGALSNDDAQMLLDLVRTVRRLVPIPPKTTNTAIMRAAHVLLNSEVPNPDKKDALWEILIPFLVVTDPSIFQGQLF